MWSKGSSPYIVNVISQTNVVQKNDTKFLYKLFIIKSRIMCPLQHGQQLYTSHIVEENILVEKVPQI